MPGSGKSTIGPLLAESLKWDFVDLDIYLESRLGVKSAEYIRSNGEEQFRARESMALRELLKRRHIVIACGGGALIDEKNHDIACAVGLIVTLHASVDALVDRLKDSSNHPLLYGGSLRQNLELMYEKRSAVYKKADIIIDTTGRTPHEAVGLIVEAPALSRLSKDPAHVV